MMARPLLLILLLVLCPAVSTAAPPSARTLSGIGLLLVKSGVASLTVYREPRLGRLTELPPAKLPDLAPSLAPEERLVPVVVLSRRPGWLRIVYDGSEGTGWVEGRRWGEFVPWERFLPGRSVRMVAGLRQDYYLLRREPVAGGEGVRSVVTEENCRAVAHEGNWLKVRCSDAAEGWLRWRDDNSRLTVVVTPGG
jgi:hypothetical protein